MVADAEVARGTDGPLDLDDGTRRRQRRRPGRLGTGGGQPGQAGDIEPGRQGLDPVAVGQDMHPPGPGPDPHGAAGHGRAEPNRRLLSVERLSRNPADGAAARAAITSPVTTGTGQRVAGMPLTCQRTQALLSAMCVFRLLPRGFTGRDLRHHLAPLLGTTAEAMTSGQLSYDLRRLRYHGFIQRIPRTHRYRVTSAGSGTPYSSPVPATGSCMAAWPNSPSRPRPSHQKSAPPPAPTRPPSTTCSPKPGWPPEPDQTQDQELDSIFTASPTQAGLDVFAPHRPSGRGGFPGLRAVCS